MKVAIYSHSFPPSIDGVCRRVSSLVYELLHEGHELLIFTLEKDLSGLDLGDFPTPPHITIESSFPATYRMKRIAHPTLKNIYRIWSGLKAFKPDVVHVTVDAVTLLFASVALLLNVPIAGSIHTDVDKILRSLNKAEWVVRTGWLLEAADSRFLDSVATTSQSYREELQQRWCHVDHVVLTSVNTDTFHPKCISPEERNAIRSRLTFGHPDCFLMLYAGRLSLEKSIEVLLDALLLPEMGDVYLAIIGDGPIAHELAELHGQEHRVYCRPGFINHVELAKLYAASDVHVSASVFETLGNTVLEANAAGVPVVVPLAQGFKDTVCSGVDGLFFEAGSSVSLSKCICQLREDPCLCKKMGDAGRRKVEGERTAAAVAADYLQWYRQTIERRALRTVFPLKWFALILLIWPFVIGFMITLRMYDNAVDLYQQATGTIETLADVKKTEGGPSRPPQTR